MPRSYSAAFAADDVLEFPATGPDLTIIDGGRRSPPTLPAALFGEVWPECVKLAQDKGAPVDYVALSYISACSSIVGGKRKVRPYPAGTWNEPAILWLGLVGDPSSNKSPAVDPFLSILRRLEIECAEKHKDQVRQWEVDHERARAEKENWQRRVKKAVKDGLPTPPMPTEAIERDSPRRRRFYVQDATPESMGEVLAGNPQGTLLLRDELEGWLSSFERYNPGGKSYWLEAYRGQPYTIDRKSNPEPLIVPFNGVSIIGGIQPQKLAESLLDKADDGLSARILWCWPDRPEFSRPFSSANLESIEEALRRLEKLDWGVDLEGRNVAVTLPLDPDAADVFECLQRAHRDHGDEASGLLKSFIGKLDGLALRLALVSELARWAYSSGPEPRSISRASVEAVGDFLETYAIPMAARVYGDAALSRSDRNAATLARYIRRKKLSSINARHIRREARLPGLRDVETVHEAIDALVEAEWLTPTPTRKGGTSGRQRADYSVNPAIFGEA